MHAVSALPGLPELAEVRKVWFSDWYDGPITGVAVHDGREYWFVVVTNDAAGGTWDFEPRVYVLHRLSREQLMQAWAMHRAFASADFQVACIRHRAMPLAPAPRICMRCVSVGRPNLRPAS
ncbi:hypothetical protein [Dactylosporangium sp. NPDC049140]|uniref:hypothetical protein n=1 Tax=Dactylosporangium sp. NPDC049140 TaxID=3155647 RepID=UPI0033D8D614